MHGASQVNSHYQILYVVLDGGRDTFLYYCGGRREQIRRALPRPIHYSLLPLFPRAVRVAAPLDTPLNLADSPHTVDLDSPLARTGVGSTPEYQ